MNRDNSISSLNSDLVSMHEKVAATKAFSSQQQQQHTAPPLRGPPGIMFKAADSYQGPSFVMPLPETSQSLSGKAAPGHSQQLSGPVSPIARQSSRMKWAESLLHCVQPHTSLGSSHNRLSLAVNTTSGGGGGLSNKEASFRSLDSFSKAKGRSGAKNSLSGAGGLMDDGDVGFKFTAATFGGSGGDDNNDSRYLEPEQTVTIGTVTSAHSRRGVKFGAVGFGGVAKKNPLDMTLMEHVLETMMSTDPTVAAMQQNPLGKRKTSMMSMITVTLQKAPGTLETLNRLRRLSQTFGQLQAAKKSKALEDSLSMFSIQAAPVGLEHQQSVQTAASAAERAMQNQVEKATINVVQMQLQKQKTEEAAIRKKFLEDIKKSHKVCMWLTVLSTVRFVIKTKHMRDETRRKEQIQGQLEPIILRWFRRMLRIVRTRMLKHRMFPPTLGAIKFDKMFSLFSDGHLMHFIDCMKPRYYFENETIVFKEISDDEAYALAEGTADVMVGKTKVFTLKPGMFFGSIGMISGEPRSATIIAREPCLVWVGCRADFESYGVKDSQVAVAHALISELRQKNMRQVYQSMLQPDNISKFELLKGVPLESVSGILADGEPRAFKTGEILLRVTRPPLHESCSYLLLRGKVQLLVAKERLSDPNLAARLSEDLAWTVDFMIKAGGRATTDIIRVANKPCADDDGDLKGLVVVAECFAPCFVGLPFVIANEFKGIAVQCVGSTDALVLRREKVLSVDILALAQIRQNSLNIRCRFMKPLTKDVLIKTIFPSTLAFDFLTNVKIGNMTLTPWVFNQGDQIIFDDDHGFEMMIVMAGEIDDGSTALPRVWPELYVAYFGCVACIAHCRTRVEAFKFTRSGLLNKLQDSLRESHLETLVGALATTFVDKRARRPNFVDSGFASGLNGRKFTRLNLKRIASIRHAPIDMLGRPTGGGGRQRRSVAGDGGLIHFLQVTAGAGSAPPKRKSISFNFDMPMVSSLRRGSTAARKSISGNDEELGMCESTMSNPNTPASFAKKPASDWQASHTKKSTEPHKPSSPPAVSESAEKFRPLFASTQDKAAATPRPPVPPLPKEARVIAEPKQVPEKDQWLVELQEAEAKQKRARPASAKAASDRLGSRSPRAGSLEVSHSTSTQMFQPTLHPAPPRPSIYQRRAHASRMQEKLQQASGNESSRPQSARPPAPPPVPHAGQNSPSLLRPSTATPQRFLNRMNRLEARLANEIFGVGGT